MRKNGTSAGLLRHLTRKCGIPEADALRMIPKKDSVSPRHALSPDQLRLFEATVRRVVSYPGVRAALLLLPRTGLRVAEVCGMTLASVAVLGRRGNATSKILGKGSKLRDVPLGKKGTALVGAYVRNERGPSDLPFVFLGPRGGRLTPAAMQAACHAVAAASGLRGLTPHVLRHTFASNALLNCQDLHGLQARLGHGKIGSKRLPAVTLTYLDV